MQVLRVGPSGHAAALATSNVTGRGVGALPALRRAKGSARELVAISNELGFCWGEHFARRDGIPFELARV